MKYVKINGKANIKSAIAKMNTSDNRIIFVVDQKERFIGLVTAIDIRRNLLNGVSLNTQICEIINKNYIIIYNYWKKRDIIQYLNSEETIKLYAKYRQLIIPILDKDREIINFKELYFNKKENKYLLKYSEKLKHKKILVIGGAGYIGSVLVRKLLKMNYYVKVFDNLLYGDSSIKELYDNKLFEFIKGDIRNIHDVIGVISDVDVVINLAALVGDPIGGLKPRDTLEINYFSSKSISEIAKYLGISKYIYASTCSIYGYNNTLCNEDSKLNPISSYAETKMLSDIELVNLDGEGFCPTILRFATVFGYSPRMRFDLVVNLLIAKAIAEKQITVYGNGKQCRPFVHIKDVCDVIIKVIEAPYELVHGEVFNVGSDKYNMSIKELAEKIKEKNSDTKMVFVGKKEDNRNYVVSFKKIEKQLDFKAKHSIDEAIYEIKEAFMNGSIKNYKDKQYSNYKFFKERNL